MKKLIPLLLCAIFALSLLPVSGMADEDNKVHIIARNLGDAVDNDNIIFKELEARTGLDIEWELWPTDGYAQQCKLLFASGEYPDGMEVWWSSYPNEFIELIEDEIIQPVDELIAQYGPNIQVTRPDTAYYDYGDGQKWGIPCRVLEDGSTYCVMIRQDWLDKLGLAMPTCFEEYYNTMKAFQENVALLTDTPGAIGGHGGTISYFQNCLSEYVFSENGFQKGWNEVDGDLVYYVNMPGYKNAMAQLRKLYQNGLMEPDYLLTNRDQFLDKLYTNVYGAWDYSTDILDPAISSWTADLYKAVPEAELAVVPPFRDENGEAHMRTVNQTIQFVVFDGAEHADNVIKLLNYLATEEGMMLVQYGIEGTHWEYDEEGNIVDLVTEDTNLAELGRGSYAWVHRLSYFGASFSSDYDDERAVISAAVEPSPVMPTTESYPDFGSTIGKLITTYTAELICNADIDFDATFEQFVQEWNEQGGAIWTEEINEYWDSRSN